MQMLLIDTEAVIRYLISQAKKNEIRIINHQSCKGHQKITMRLNENWEADLLVDHTLGNEFPGGFIGLKKDGCLWINGFFYRHRTSLLYEYARDFCKRVVDGSYLETENILKEALPGLQLP